MRTTFAVWLLSCATAAAAGAPVDHAPFDALLRAHVRAGLVDYEAFARAPAFRVYLDRLASATLDDAGEAERLAFWLNAYNAWTIALVNAHGERASIRNIGRLPRADGTSGPWSEPFVRAAGRSLTLDDVEQRILRREFHEPRIHFALVCAALGCPSLRPEAYAAGRLEAQLEDQAAAFLARAPEKNRVDAPGRTVWVSPILLWYRDDFGGSDEAIGRYIARYWPEGPARQLLLSGRFEVRETAYDWSLNIARPGR
jgi:hypothetical protein